MHRTSSCFSKFLLVTNKLRNCTYFMSHSSMTRPMTVHEAQQFWSEQFFKEDIPESTSSIDHILAHILGLKDVTRLASIQSQILNPKENIILEKMGHLRLKHMPIQYILGEWDFMELTLKMQPPVFIPRPETENLVSLISETVCNPQTCLEIGVGTGAISLALLNHYHQLHCTGIDVNPVAVNLAQTNALLLKLNHRFDLQVALLDEDGVTGIPHQQFDIVVSNPPYIPSEEIPALEKQIVWYEDHRALDGGKKDGILIIERILNHSLFWLRPGGYIFIEVDPRQIQKIMDGKFSERFSDIHVHKDCFGLERFVVLKL